MTTPVTRTELARKQPAEIVRAEPTYRPAVRSTAGGWVLPFVLFFLPILFITMAALGYVTGR